MNATTVHIVQRLAPGGLEVLATDIARGIGYRSAVISLSGTTDALVAGWDRLRNAPYEIVGLAKTEGIDPGLVGRLTAVLKGFRPQVVITHHIGPLVYGGPASRLAGVPVLVQVEHDAWHLRSRRRRLLMRCLVASLKPKLVSVSTVGAIELRSVLPASPVRVIENGVDVNRFIPGPSEVSRRRHGLPIGVPLVGSVGRLESVKGHDLLIDAFAKLPLNTHLAIVGDGTMRSTLEAKVRDLGIADRVSFLGHQDDLPGIYPCFDLFVLPSRNEGLPITVLEAQACGVRVVATKVGAVRDAVCPVTGSLVDSECPSALAHQISYALHHVPDRSPRDFVTKRFGMSNMLAAYRDVMEI